MKKITINNFYMEDAPKGQGVGSATLEQIKLVENINGFNVLRNKKNENSDISHFHTMEFKNRGILKKRKKRNDKIVFHVHFIPTTLDGSIKINRVSFYFLKKYVISMYKKADKLVIVNPIFIDDLVSLGIDKEKIEYIPNFVSKTKFHPQEESKVIETKEKYNIDKNSFVVLGVGQVQHRKGVLDFVETAKNNPDMTFVWAGGFSFGKITDGYKELKKIMEAPPVENLKFIGIIPREDMNDIYNMSDVLFVPSYNELFPMSILETINSHKPLVLRDLELYENILFKKYIKCNNNSDFSKELISLKNDKKYYDLNSNLSKEISEFYSKENVMIKWEEFYKKM